ncbi:MAG: hypothetical protein VYB93_10975 [Pseudomonadota bacterium]|nr:hypothetical protein [Pseudomonadota bacterium]
MTASIWVGEIEGKALVHDPKIQLPDCPHLFLWDPNSGEMGKFIAGLIRKRIKPHTEPSGASEHIAAYLRWHKAHGAKWLNEEKRYYESRRKCEAAQEEQRKKRQEDQRTANLSPEERHKERLERLGRMYLGVVRATPNSRRRRFTHCYACRRDLDNSIDIECVACGWIICTCGACGCGYSALV